MKAALRKIRRKLMPSWTDEWARVQQELPGLKGLHIGCGTDSFGSMTRLDFSTTVKPDILWDLTKFPLPIEDDSYDIIVAFNIVEHIQPFFDLFADLHRILKPGGRLLVFTPHFSSAGAFIDPTHVKFISGRSYDYFITGSPLEKEYGFYVDYRFTLVKRMISLAGWWQKIPFLAERISRHPAFWEDHLCQMMRGSGVYVELRKV